MRLICLLALLILPATEISCSKQNGTIKGSVVGPVPGISITALQDGKAITTVAPSKASGDFSLKLKAGIYDIKIASSPDSFPIIMQQISVETDKITDLQTIAFPTSNGQATSSTLSGKVIPSRAKISLLSEDREMASVRTDQNGSYLFREIPAGVYTLHVTSPQYAPDAVRVSVSEKGTQQDVRLFYASVEEGLDWEAGKIRVTGRGVPPDNAPNHTVRREMAKRAALADAERKLVKAVAEIKTGPDQNVRTYLGETKFTRIIEGYIKGYRITAERELNDGTLEVDLELPLTGENGLSRYLYN